MNENVIEFPVLGKAITSNDQGVYFTMNTKTGMVHSIFRLDFEYEWYLHQLQNVGQSDEFAWTIMAESGSDVMKSMASQDIHTHFGKPEFAKPKGAWQVIRNSLFGFGKFTPEDPNAPVSFALIPFIDNVMQTPVLIVKADDASLQQAEHALGMTLEMA